MPTPISRIFQVLKQLIESKVLVKLRDIDDFF